MIPPPLPSFMSGPKARKQAGRFSSLASQSSTTCRNHPCSCCQVAPVCPVQKQTPQPHDNTAQQIQTPRLQMQRLHACREILTQGERGRARSLELSEVSLPLHACRYCTVMLRRGRKGLTVSSSVAAGEPLQRKPMTLRAPLSMSPSMAGKLLLAGKYAKKLGDCQCVNPACIDLPDETVRTLQPAVCSAS